MKDFRTYELALELAKISKGIKLKGPYQNQFQRAVLSIALNLSEGSSRSSVKERRHFYQVAFGSLREVQTLVEILELESIRQLTDRLAAHCYRLCLGLRDS